MQEEWSAALASGGSHRRMPHDSLPLGSVLTRLAVGLGPPSAHGAAGAVRPIAADREDQRHRTTAVQAGVRGWVPRCPNHSARALS